MDFCQMNKMNNSLKAIVDKWISCFRATNSESAYYSKNLTRGVFNSHAAIFVYIEEIK